MRAVTATLFLAAVAAVAAGAPAGAQSAPPDAPFEVVLSGEADRLNAYDAATGEKRTIVPNSGESPTGLDINAEICFVPEGVPWKPAGEVWFIAGEDTEQNTEPGVIKQGWGFFRLTGTTLATLAVEQVGKLVPDSFVTESDNPENYGCGVLPDGRVVTTDVGDQLPQDPATGQLIVWFPTADDMRHVGPDRNDFARVAHCKIDVGIGTAGGMAVDGADVLVASNRPNLATVEPGGVYRYDTAAWPTGETAADGCGRADATGEQLADADRVGKELFIPQVPGLLLTPSDIVDSGRGTWYVSSVFSGQVAEYGHDGVLRRHVVTTTGQLGGITPYGLGVDASGDLWIADIGILGPGPAPQAGSVVRVPIATDGTVGAMEVVDEGLDFPDGIGIRVLGAAGPSGPSGPSGADPTGATPTTTSGVVAAGGSTRGGVLARTGGPALPLVVVAAALAAGVLGTTWTRRSGHTRG
jgi:hypothetical protein